MDGDQAARVLYLMILVVSVGGWLLVEYRSRLGVALRTLMAWALIILGLAAGYGLWADLRRDVIPDQFTAENGAIEIPRAVDGHYYLTLDINGTKVRFLADTGASNIVLSPEDAEALGFDPANLRFLGEAHTANGVVRTAVVTLDEVRLGPVLDRNLTAYVNQAPMQGSLLGMDYLGLFRIEISGDRMILRR
jgi:aspartyl protease family protein